MKKLIMMVMVMIMVMVIPSSVYAEDGRGYYENTTRAKELDHQMKALEAQYDLEESIYDDLGGTDIKVIVTWRPCKGLYLATVTFRKDGHEIFMMTEVDEDEDEVWVTLDIDGKRACRVDREDEEWTEYGEKYRDWVNAW